jgi:hypothetical protein
VCYSPGVGQSGGRSSSPIVQNKVNHCCPLLRYLARRVLRIGRSSLRKVPSQFPTCHVMKWSPTAGCSDGQKYQALQISSPQTISIHSSDGPNSCHSEKNGLVVTALGNENWIKRLIGKIGSHGAAQRDTSKQTGRALRLLDFVAVVFGNHSFEITV